MIHPCALRSGQTRPAQTRPDQASPDQTRPDQASPTDADMNLYVACLFSVIEEESLQPVCECILFLGSFSKKKKSKKQKKERRKKKSNMNERTHSTENEKFCEAGNWNQSQNRKYRFLFTKNRQEMQFIRIWNRSNMKIART